MRDVTYLISTHKLSAFVFAIISSRRVNAQLQITKATNCNQLFTTRHATKKQFLNAPLPPPPCELTKVRDRPDAVESSRNSGNAHTVIAFQMCTLSTAVRDVTARERAGREQVSVVCCTAVCGRINYWNWHPYCISIFIRSNFTVQQRRHLSILYIFVSHSFVFASLCRASVAPPTGRANKTKARLNFELSLSALTLSCSLCKLTQSVA